MQILTLLFSAFILLSVSISSGAQTASVFPIPSIAPSYDENSKNYNDCAAILYKGNVLVTEYSPKGRCKLEQGMTGPLTVAAVVISDEGIAAPVKNIGFKVAIKNGRTNTLYMYSEQILREVQLEDILKKCERGDKIVIMTVDQQYSLPHHEIALHWGC